MDRGQPEGPKPSEFGYAPELKRTLSLTDLVVYGLIFISPIAPFAITPSVYMRGLRKNAPIHSIVRPRRMWSGSCFTMPKSSITSFPSGVQSPFDACGSAWK